MQIGTNLHKSIYPRLDLHLCDPSHGHLLQESMKHDTKYFIKSTETKTNLLYSNYLEENYFRETNASQSIFGWNLVGSNVSADETYPDAIRHI